MFKSFSVILVVFTILCLRSIESHRKILDGEAVNTDTGYMVYLLKSPVDKAKYDSWICGGAIVTEYFIVTSAACIKDVTYMYAIAGYKEYYKVARIDEDECMKGVKKKIVEICVPETYELKYEKLEVWSNVDIGMVKVESPYVFNEKPEGCTWNIQYIELNYDKRYQAPGNDAVVLGWGHDRRWRDQGDSTDMNQPILQASSILLVEKEVCLKAYVGYNKNMEGIIQNYMICADGEGNIDVTGKVRTKENPDNDGCPPNLLRVGNKCVDPKRLPGGNNRVKKKYLRTGPELNDIDEEIELNSDQKNSSATTHDDTTGSSRSSTSKRDNMAEHSTTVELTPNVNISTTVEQTDNVNISKTVEQISNMNISKTVEQIPNTNISTSVEQSSITMNISTTVAPLSNITRELNQTFTDKKGNKNKFKDTENDSDSFRVFLQDLVIQDILKKYPNDSALLSSARKSGICQNDHGGPLVRWIGNKEYVIGVSSVFRINDKNECTGPFLFTSTACNSRFLNCVLNDTSSDPPPQDKTRRDICNLPPEERGFDIITRRISWANHPDGPAANEIIAKQDLFVRPQRPLHEFHRPGK